jgi:AraC-like DNA-binding protein
MNYKTAKLHDIGQARVGPDWYIANHSHQDLHQIIVVNRGATKVIVDGKRFTAEVGDVLFYRNESPHEEWADKKREMHTFFLSFCGKIPHDVAPVKVHDAQGRLRELAHWLHEESQNRTLANGEVIQGFFRAFLAEWLRLARHREATLLNRLRQHVRNHIMESIDLDQLAKEAGMSKYHFLRCYKELAGTTPMDDVRRIRLEHARSLIMTTDFPLKEVAHRSGLGSQIQLTRLFRKYYDSTPGRLRKRH